jgi:methionyl-tRNA formyltransferase
MESVFSVRPLEALLAAGHDVRFVLRPIGPLSSRTEPVLKRHRGFDLAMRRLLGLNDDAKNTNPLAVAADRDIPAWLCGNASTPQVQQLLKKEKVDLIVVAFFNQLLKPAVFSIPPLGAINFHPSLLPAYRGPAPLFWIYKDGCESTGLTIHKIAAGEDDGAVLRCLPLPVPLGLPGEDLVDELADLAAGHVVAAVADTANGVKGTAQDPAGASRAPRPVEADLVVDGALPARRLFHFARGVGRWNPLWCAAVGDRFRVLDADSFDDSAALPGEHALVGDILHLGTIDGVVRLKVRPIA